MAILRYKNESFLKYVGTVIINSNTLIGQKHIAKILQSFAILGYTSDITNMIIEVRKRGNCNCILDVW